MPLVVQYSGRACLLGEHCDWAGGASLTVPLPMSVRLAVEDASEGIRLRTALHGQLHDQRVELNHPDASTAPPALRFLPAAVAALQDAGLELRPATLWCHASLPAGRGFSSSAAFVLAVLDGLARHAGHTLSDTHLAELAYEVEAVRVGVPCGRLDPLACVAGAPVFLRWTDGRAPLRRIRLARPVHLVVAAFPRPRATEAILRALQQAHNAPMGSPADPPAVAAVREALELWSDTATRGARALADGHLSALGAAMNEAQGAYERAAALVPALHAPLLASACHALREAGALGAKFSGAGGDGSVVALAKTRPDAETLAGLLSERGLSVWKASLETP